MADVIQLARELGKAIQGDEAFQQFNTARERADNDKALQDLIGEFNLKRMALSNAMSETDEPDQDKLDKLDTELKTIYNDVMGNPAMAEVNAAKQGVDSMMGFINQILTASVNGEDPFTVEQQSSCGGECSGCSGCH